MIPTHLHKQHPFYYNGMCVQYTCLSHLFSSFQCSDDIQAGQLLQIVISPTAIGELLKQERIRADVIQARNYPVYVRRTTVTSCRLYRIVGQW
jgi:hypothetical protein